MLSHRRANEAPLRRPPKRVGATMWFRRRADEAPLPRAAEGRRALGIHQAAADVAPLSNAGAFFSKNVRWWRSNKFQKNVNCLLLFHELELELILSHMTQKPMLRGEVVRPARPLLKLRKLCFHGELAWGEPTKGRPNPKQQGDSAAGRIKLAASTAAYLLSI
jgi:hypothetical protein